jgi:hypothetical protein
MGLAALGHKKLIPGLSLGAIMRTSATVGDVMERARSRKEAKPVPQREASSEAVESSNLMAG